MTHKRLVLAVCAAVLLLLPVFGQSTEQTTDRALTDIPYRAHAARTDYERERCKLDLYLPEKKSGFATLVWFHGGSLKSGDKSGEMTVAIARRFARDGIACATVNYRLHPRVTFPVYLEDAAASVAWVYEHIAEHGGDPRKVFVSGHSAGGYLTAMLALDPRYLAAHGLPATCVAGLIPVSGQMVTHSTVREERGIARTTPVIDPAAPSYHAKPNTPPLLCICGSEDLPARAAENIYFVAAMKAAGHGDVTYLEVEGRNHGTIASGIPQSDDVVAAAITEFVASRSAARTEAPGKAELVSRGHRILAADSSKHRIAIVSEDGEIEWEHEIGPLHDLHLLANGNMLFQTSWTRLVEMNRSTGETVWEYDAAKQNRSSDERVEVHAFQRLPNGLTMIAESGRARIIEVDRDGSVVHEVALRVDRPDPHRDTRLVRKLRTGNYLVSHEGLGRVREYDAQGEIVWDYEVPLFGKERRDGHGLDAFGNATFCALRLENGNTLVSTGNGHSVLEVTPEKEIVWSVHQDDLADIRLAWVTTLQVLPNGNIVLGNCHAGPDNPQIIEITREKEVVWTFRDFEQFGNALSNSRIVDGVR